MAPGFYTTMALHLPALTQRFRLAGALAGLCLACSGLGAQTVTLSGILGDKALLIVDGSAPKMLGTGQSHLGVKLLAVQETQVAVEIAGKRVALRMGDAPASVGSNAAAAGAGSKIVLPVGSGGHFVAQGQINGQTVQFLVDTGATAVSLGMEDATRLGLNYQIGIPVRIQTANGEKQGWRIKLSSVQVGDVKIYDVEAVVSQVSMPFALLGNSFLSRFEMNRNSDQLVLVKRY